MSAGEEYLPPVLDDEANRYINKTAFDKPVVDLLSTVIYWGCRKEEKQSYLQFLQEKKKKIKKWKDHEIIKLNATDCSTYDASFMVLLIPEVCQGIDKNGSVTWTKEDNTKIEWLITKLKNLRNDDTHEPEGAAISPKTLDSIKKLVGNILTVAGEMYLVEADIIQETKDRLIKTIDEIKGPVMTSKEKRMIKLKEDICKECTNEIEKTVVLQATEKLPFSNADLRRSDIFHPSRFSVVKNRDKIPTVNSILTCDGLINNLTKDGIIITGQPGSGKSTLLRSIREDFALTKPKIFTGIKAYSLLLYMECGNANLSTIPQLLRNNFPKTCQNMDDEAAVEIFKSLKLLIVVDGIDESTECSKHLLNALLEVFGEHGEASFIFTSRPGDVQILKRTLSEKGLTYSTASIEPLTDEKEQIEYLKRYQKHVQEINAPGLVEAFKKLDDPCKNCLIQPVYLSLFCHLFCSSQHVVAEWKNELGVMEQTLEVSKDFIRKRLRIEEITEEREQNELSTKLIAILCDLSVGQVLKDKMTLDHRTYRRLCMYSFGDRYVNYYTILSCVVVGHSHQSYFQYVHKTQAEFLAARAILKRLKSDSKLSVLGAISKVTAEFRIRMQDGRNRGDGADDNEAQLSTEEACKYENTFKFLIMMLWEARSEKPDLFNRCLFEVCQTLTDGDTPFSYWAELYLSCPSQDVAEAAAEAARSADPWWNANNPRYMRAAITMLKLRQPPRLEVKVAKPEHGSFTQEFDSTTLKNASTTLENASPPLENASPTLENDSPSLETVSTTLETLMKIVAECFNGQFTLDLWHSYRSFTPVDKLITILVHSNCKLCYFAGCLEGDSAAWQVLRDGLTRALVDHDSGPSLFLSLLSPRLHQLDHLNGTPHRLVLDAKMTMSDGDQKSCRLPLSKTQPPILTVVCSSDGGYQGAKVAALFIDLAPEDKKYAHIIVQQWKATDEELNVLVKTLSKAGLRTPTKGGNPGWRPTGMDSDGSCRTCGGSFHRPGERCVQIELPKPTLRIVSKRLIVTTDEDMAWVTKHLPNPLFPWLVVHTARAQPVPPALGPLMEAIGKYHKGTLDLYFLHSDRDFVPVDDLLTHLESAQCSLVYFRGCLRGDSEQAWRALTEGFLRAEQDEIKQSLALTLLEPRQHMLHQLEGTQHQLELRTRLPMETSVQGRRPLPETSSKPAMLKIDCAPAAAGQLGADETRVERAAALIKDLAPGNLKHYYRLDLQNWPGSDQALDKLIAELSAARVCSPATGSSSWTRSYRYDGLCSTCQESSVHAPGQRCVQLHVCLPEEEDGWSWNE